MHIPFTRKPVGPAQRPRLLLSARLAVVARGDVVLRLPQS